MSKPKNAKLKQKTNATPSQQLFTPLNHQEQQTITGGWSSRSSTSSSSSFW